MGPHPMAARASLGRAVAWCGCLGRPLVPSFHLYKAPDIKTPGRSTFLQKEFRSSASTENRNPGTRNSILALCRDGELEEIIAIIITDASPSTIHDSPIHV